MKNINLIAAINNLGYGQVGRNILLTLVKEGIDVSFWPIAPPSHYDPSDVPIIQQAIDNQAVFDADGASLRIWHQHDLALRIGNGLNCGFPIFELDAFKDNEKVHLNSCDRLFVTSQWAKKVIHANLPKFDDDSVVVAPLGVDTSIFYPDPSVRPHEDTIFFTVGKWEYRKGHTFLSDAWNVMADKYDNVQLWLMTHNPFPQVNNQEWEGKFQHRDRVRFIEPVTYHHEVADIMRQVDCGVFPSCAEGWNMGALEMMACGKHVIMTDYSAHTEYADIENSLLIDITATEIAYDGIWFKDNIGEWASLDMEQFEQLLAHMEDVHRQKQGGDSLHNEEGWQTAKMFTWKNTATKILEGLK